MNAVSEDPREELAAIARELKKRCRACGGKEQQSLRQENCVASSDPVMFQRRQSAPETAVPRLFKPTLQDLRAEMGDCTRCHLHQGRKHIVFGEGDPQAELIFVGEAPGEQEDLQGRPFVGRAGQLLTKIIEAMGMGREDVYICNILKCRPPGNRNPKIEEIDICEPFLVKQLQTIEPKVICALGSIAARTLLKTELPITVLRGNFHFYRDIRVMPTYHPAYLLRNPSAKKHVWRDVQLILEFLKKHE
ncbi:MAG: uracil-DNA glycosylase [Deltaproteobacteria bacterium]|nr:uracil-DNA glycosylase [Deltaproteobacteria bacterium]